MPNRLASETSPYLLQHANNPVDWHPWGDEAIARSRSLDRPIFLSIGYSACHWCHVMEHESFEDAKIAELLNANFISIKVDREERPDLDQIYMSAVQLLTGRGGWPMSVFLTGDLKPFYGGTYWPPTSRMGLPGFAQVLEAVREAWVNRRPTLLEQAEQICSGLEQAGNLARPAEELTTVPLRNLEAALERSFDHRHGGFGGAPKFPHPMDLRVLLRRWRETQRPEVLHLVTHTLAKMSDGGIYDHLGGGFHRYSVDERWLVPHFEKMLYDNALLSIAYVEAWQATGHARYAGVVRETLDYVLREMTDTAGGFYSAQDADSEGHEGKFFVWTRDEIRELLGDARSEVFCYVYDVTDEGNFEGQNILNKPKTIEQAARIRSRELDELQRELDACRAILLKARQGRVWPGLDDKILTSWNGLMIEAMAMAGAALGEPRYLEAAAKAAAFLLEHLRGEDGRLLHGWRQGRARFNAYLDDYACLANALVTLYESDFNERWIDEALKLADVMLRQFADGKAGAFFYTSHDHEALISRHKDVQDSSVPSANAMSATVLARLGKLCARSDYLDAARGTLAAFQDVMQRHPTATGQMLLALSLLVEDTPEVVLLGQEHDADTRQVLAELRRRFWPNRVLARRPAQGNSAALAGLFAGKSLPAQGPALYVCRNFSCQAPAIGLEAVRAACDQLAPASHV